MRKVLENRGAKKWKRRKPAPRETIAYPVSTVSTALLGTACGFEPRDVGILAQCAIFLPFHRPGHPQEYRRAFDQSGTPKKFERPVLGNAIKWSRPAGFQMICPECSSSSFRLSQFRTRDLERLALFQYPVRCRKCHWRSYVGFPLALMLLQVDRARRESRVNPAPRSGK